METRIRSLCLVVSASNPLVDNVKKGLLLNGSGHKKRHEAQHCEAAVEDFCFFRKTKLQGGHVSVSSLVVDRFHFFVTGVAGVDQKTITKRRRADGGHQRDTKEVSVGDQNEGTFVGDGVLARDGGQSTPLLQVQERVGVRDQTMSLAVSRGADEEPSEHGMTSIPLFSLDGRSPSVLGELWELFFPVSHGVFVNTRGCKARRGTNTGHLSRRLGGGESRNGSESHEEGEKGSERRHCQSLRCS
mmetsp:Transcript_5817/g.11379  ORF Transcript_5817/g.11379 Transcript_5817/m.11379 type:complete len:244 (-) Transcript_5817:18-749(-)